MNQEENNDIPSGMRVVISIIVFFGLLIFAIIYVAFFASSFSLFQQIAIILVALLAGVGILGVAWASWSIKVRQKIERQRCNKF